MNTSTIHPLQHMVPIFFILTIINSMLNSKVLLIHLLCTPEVRLHCPKLHPNLLVLVPKEGQNYQHYSDSDPPYNVY